MSVETQFTVNGMHCASCGLLIDETVEELDGVDRCETDVKRGRSRVTYDPDRVTVDAIAAAVVEAGYQTELGSSDG